jgi:hypothetical protein
MTKFPALKRLGFFSRLLDQTDAAERYRLATAQIAHAERWGFDSAWIAQHHFHEGEGGLPAPFVFLWTFNLPNALAFLRLRFIPQAQLERRAGCRPDRASDGPCRNPADD